MKKLLLLFLFFVIISVQLRAQALLEKNSVFNSSFGEICLEDYYMSTPYKISFVIDVNDDSVAPVPEKKKVGAEKESQIELYNEDMTHYKTIKLSELDADALKFVSIESAKLGDKRFYTTERLFNSDDLYEFVILAEKYFAIVNEKGKVLYKENFDDDFVLGSDFSVYLFETSSVDNTYLLVELVDTKWNYTTNMYKININNNESGINNESKLTKIRSYPNPVKDYLNIDYDLGVASSGIITFIDLNGKEVLRKSINNANASCRLSLNALQSGIYFMNISAGDKIISTEKIIIK